MLGGFPDNFCDLAGNFSNGKTDYVINRRYHTMLTLAKAGIAIFSLAVVLGPLYKIAEYSFVTNLISQLGAPAE